MGDLPASPPGSRPPRSFLPLAPLSDALLTRGQTLQGLIQCRSSASLRGYPSAGADAVFARRDDGEQHSAVLDGGESGLARAPRRKNSLGLEALLTPQMRSMRLIGHNNRRYQWERYHKTDEELKKMKRPIRQYYQRNNFLISQYLYIDRLLDSSLPHNLLQEYNEPSPGIPRTITEEPADIRSPSPSPMHLEVGAANGSSTLRVKRTPKTLYNLPKEDTPLLDGSGDGPSTPGLETPNDETVDSGSPIVTVAIYINFAANAVLLGLKIAAVVLVDSLSVLASLVDAALDFLSTVIVWATTKLIARQDQYAYPIGRRRLEPLGVLVFSVVMITSFVQVALECFNRLTSGDHGVVQLTAPAIAIMATTVVVKLACWFWCRLIKNSSVQALAQDAMTDVVFNTFSIIFPLVGHYASIWWLDALGGLLLSLYVIVNWSRTSAAHIRNLSGAAASADERNVLLYLTMRFAKTIKQIQGLQAYHAGDKLNVEVDIVLDEAMPLRDSHDLGESLQYVLESVPMVDRAFVHMDYRSDNLPTHMQQQE